MTIRRFKEWLETIPEEFLDFEATFLSYGTVEEVNTEFKLSEAAIFPERSAVVFPIPNSQILTYKGENKLNENVDMEGVRNN